MRTGALIDSKSEQYVFAVTDGLRRVLGDALAGVYLHGSAALGDFQTAGDDRSDIDVLAVVSRSLTRNEKYTIAHALSPEALPCPAESLELDIVTLDSARHSEREPRFELHMVSASRNDDKVVDGARRDGNTDLLMHVAVCREHARALLGPPPPELFAPIPRTWLVEAFVEELNWAEKHASPAYQILNACRAWRYAAEGVLCSKTSGGEWAQLRYGDPSVIHAALALRRGGRHTLHEMPVRSLVEHVRAILVAARAGRC